MRFMRIDHMENGVPMLLDWRDMTIVPRITVARSDYENIDNSDKMAEEGRLFETKTPWQHGVSETTLEEITPEMALEKSQEILRRLKHMPELSVGDLSGLKSDRRGLLELYVHPKDGRSLLELYEHSAPQWAPIAESQRLLKESQKKRQDEKETAFLIKQIMFRRQIEKEIMRENARRHLAL